MAQFLKKKYKAKPISIKKRFFKRTSDDEKIEQLIQPSKPQPKQVIKPINSPIEELIRSSRDVAAEPETQISEIRRFIRDEADERIPKEPVVPINPRDDVFIDTPESFDGVSNNGEKLQLLEERLIQENRRARKLEHEINLLKAEFEEEKRQLEHTIKELKHELHRTVPLHDNKFFSLSKELRAAMDDIAQIAKPGEVSLSDPSPTFEPSPILAMNPLPAVDNAKLSSSEPGSQESSTPAPPKEVILPPEAAKPKKTNKKRSLITGAVAIVIILLLTGSAGYSYLQKPPVDQALVNEYLAKQGGTVAGAQVTSDQTEPETLPPEPTIDPASAKIPFEQTVWDTFKEPIFGVEFKYPQNAVKLNRTDSNITFLRDSGYLFKLQRVETALSLKDYWEQIKATTLDYTVEDTRFKNKKALHLTLEDQTDFPGNRYLIEVDGFIYDIWYATQSDKFTTDDIKRVQEMVESLTFI